MEVANSAVKAALDNLLTLHKNAGSDTEFMSSGFEIIQTLLNNIHMAQSHMFASLIGGITKTNPVIQKTVTHPIPYTHNKDIDTYMSQFSNISISTNKKELQPLYHDNKTNLIIANGPLSTHNRTDVTHNDNVQKGNGPIDKWLREMREKESEHLYGSLNSEINEFEQDHYLNPITKHNVFDEDDGSYRPVAWHEKVNVDVEQCCARIGNQLFMIDNMDSEFLDNYPPDTYIDESGFVHGRSCLRTIDVNLFNSGQIFCNDHLIGYDDIRKAPLNRCSSPEYDFM